MKRIKKILSAGIAASLLVLVGCEGQAPFTPQTQDENIAGSKKQLSILRLKSKNTTLAKTVTSKEWITQSNGGTLELQHGFSAAGNSGFLYGVSYNSPYNIYQIDPADVSNPVQIGELEFKTKAIAVHPQTGQVFYVSKNNINGLYPLAVWDPESNSNTVLPHANAIRPCDKLAFGEDGTLYSVNRDDKYEVYTINTATGEWSFHIRFNKHLSAYGDMAFGPGGVFYNVNGYNSKFQIIDLASGSLSTIDKTNLDDMSGIATGSDGVLYVSRENGKIYSVNPSNADATYLGDSGIDELEDLASPYFDVELSYVSVSLEIPPMAISQNMDLELSLETTELAGGVAVTFGPHGTTFSDPAILNISANGVDFSGVDPDDVDIYYDNQESGVWELMSRDDVIIDVNQGTIQVINARLPHFSRFALGAN